MMDVFSNIFQLTSDIYFEGEQLELNLTAREDASRQLTDDRRKMQNEKGIIKFGTSNNYQPLTVSVFQDKTGDIS